MSYVRIYSTIDFQNTILKCEMSKGHLKRDEEFGAKSVLSTGNRAQYISDEHNIRERNELQKSSRYNIIYFHV